MIEQHNGKIVGVNGSLLNFMTGKGPVITYVDPIPGARYFTNFSLTGTASTSGLYTDNPLICKLPNALYNDMFVRSYGFSTNQSKKIDGRYCLVNKCTNNKSSRPGALITTYDLTDKYSLTTNGTISVKIIPITTGNMYMNSVMFNIENAPSMSYDFFFKFSSNKYFDIMVRSAIAGSFTTFNGAIAYSQDDLDHNQHYQKFHIERDVTKPVRVSLFWNNKTHCYIYLDDVKVLSFEYSAHSSHGVTWSYLRKIAIGAENYDTADYQTATYYSNVAIREFLFHSIDFSNGGTQSPNFPPIIGA